MSQQEIVLCSLKTTLTDNGGDRETEAMLRFSRNGDAEELFIGGHEVPLRAMERAVRQMLAKFQLFDGEIDESFFGDHQLGTTKFQIHSVKLFEGERISSNQLSHATDEDCPNRAAITAICQLYQNKLGVQFILPWQQVPAGTT